MDFRIKAYLSPLSRSWLIQEPKKPAHLQRRKHNTALKYPTKNKLRTWQSISGCSLPRMREEEAFPTARPLPARTPEMREAKSGWNLSSALWTILAAIEKKLNSILSGTWGFKSYAGPLPSFCMKSNIEKIQKRIPAQLRLLETTLIVLSKDLRIPLLSTFVFLLSIRKEASGPFGLNTIVVWYQWPSHASNRLLL